MRFVLLHSPLTGPSTWAPVAAELARRGIDVTRLVIPPLGEMAPPLYAGVGEALAAQFRGQGGQTVLAVHSGAGALAPSVVAAAGDQVKAVLYVDSILPHPGRNWFDTASTALGDDLKAKVVGGLIPAWDQWFPPGAAASLLLDSGLRDAVLSELVPTPLVWFEEAAPEVGLPSGVGSGFLRLSKAYEREAEEALLLGWPTLRCDLHHLAMVTHPVEVAETMLGLTRLLGLRAA